MLHQKEGVRMINWTDQDFYNKRGAKTTISAATFREACHFIRQHAKTGNFLPYSELMNKLKKSGYRKIHRGTIGSIVGEVSDQVSLTTNPSVYPSAIIVHKGTEDTGKGFWALEEGTLPPKSIPVELRKKALGQYQKDVFDKIW
jgi:hypothetical protein